MKNARSLLILLVVAGLAAAIGFATARLVRRGEPAPASDSIGQGRPPLAPAPSRRAPAPELRAALARARHAAVPKDRAEFETRVAALHAEGCPEALARWLTIAAAIRADLPASFRLAAETDLKREWAAAAALENPEAAFPLVRTWRGGAMLDLMGGESANGAFFRTLGRVDPALGLAFLRRLNSFEAGNTAPAFFKGWAETDPAAARTAAGHLESPWVRETALLGLFRQWGQGDRREMLRWALAQGAPTAKLAFRAQLDLGARQNSEEMLALAREFPEAADANTLTNLAGGLVSKGAAGWPAIADFPAGAKRDRMISWFANRLANQDHATTLPPADREKFLDWTAIRILAKVAPAEVAQIVRDGKERRASEMRDVISAWAGQDPAAAFAWSSANLAGQPRAAAMESALGGWVKSDPAAAIGAMNALPPGLRAKVLPDLLSAWGGRDAKAALAFTGQLPALDRVRATDSLFRGWAFADAPAAAQALLASPGNVSGSAYDQVAWRFADRDPAAAMDWAARVADPAMQKRAAGRIAEAWAGKDAAAVSDRLVALEPGAFRDGAVAGFVGAINDLDPPTAATWAGSIADADLRKSNLRKVLTTWKTKDPNAAKAFAAQLPASKLKDDMAHFVNQ